jgi:hypothetical protein
MTFGKRVLELPVPVFGSGAFVVKRTQPDEQPILTRFAVTGPLLLAALLAWSGPSFDAQG